MKFSGNFRKALVLAPSFAAIAEPAAVIEGFAANESIEQTPASPFEASAENVSAGASLTFTLIHERDWSETMERRFSKLTALKAADKASREQLLEWRELRDLRRMKRNPLSSDEILFQYRRREHERRVLEALNEYVEFLDRPRRPEKQVG